MSSEIHFFATGPEIAERLKIIEMNRPIRIIECKAYDSKADIVEYHSVDEFKNLGINTSGDHIRERHIIMDAKNELVTEKVKQISGGFKYFVEEPLNKTAISFWPGGFYNSDYLICGHISTIAQDKDTKQFFNLIKRHFVRGFNKVGAFYVSKKTYELDEHIRLITIDVNQSIEYDFQLH